MARRRFPVTVRQLPAVTCQLCRRRLPYQPGQAGAVLTAHYEKEHPEALASAPRSPN